MHREACAIALDDHSAHAAEQYAAMAVVGMRREVVLRATAEHQFHWPCVALYAAHYGGKGREVVVSAVAHCAMLVYTYHEGVGVMRRGRCHCRAAARQERGQEDDES